MDTQATQDQLRQSVSSLAQLEWSKYDSQWSDLTDIEAEAKNKLLAAGMKVTDPAWSTVLQDTIKLLQEQLIL